MIIDGKNCTADGIGFEDLKGMHGAVVTTLVARGQVWATEFKDNGKTYGGTIIASSLEEAERIAFGRGLGEEVLGKLETAVGDY